MEDVKVKLEAPRETCSVEVDDVPVLVGTGEVVIPLAAGPHKLDWHFFGDNPEKISVTVSKGQKVLRKRTNKIPKNRNELNNTDAFNV